MRRHTAAGKVATGSTTTRSNSSVGYNREASQRRVGPPGGTLAKPHPLRRWKSPSLSHRTADFPTGTEKPPALLHGRGSHLRGAHLTGRAGATKNLRR